MKSKVFIYVIVISFLLPITLSARDEITKGNSQVQSQIDSMAMELSNRNIGRIEILQIPPYIETYARITPEMLERSFYYKLTIRDASGGIYGQKLAELLKSLKVKPRSEMEDIRWGIIFYDVNDSRAGAIYFDKWGTNGAVGDIPVSFRGGLFRWLKGTFSHCFR
ncbi:MAG TPA: hypothetical protein VMT04_09170 [Terriglobales bacterium]|nr:hypothetical protein [Terriglobales bacterium]